MLERWNVQHYAESPAHDERAINDARLVQAGKQTGASSRRSSLPAQPKAESQKQHQSISKELWRIHATPSTYPPYLCSQDPNSDHHLSTRTTCPKTQLLGKETLKPTSMPSSAGLERMRRNWLSWFSVCYCFPPIHIVFSNPKLLWNWPSEYRLRVAVCSRKEGRRLGETKILLSQLMSKEIMEKSKRRAFTLPHVV